MFDGEYHSACSGKFRYKTKADAIKIALKVERERPSGRKMCAYHCKRCGMFHWGHLPDKRKNK